MLWVKDDFTEDCTPRTNRLLLLSLDGGSVLKDGQPICFEGVPEGAISSVDDCELDLWILC